MATTEVTPNANGTATLNELPIVTENKTYSRVLINAQDKEKADFEPEWKVMDEEVAKKYVEDHKDSAVIHNTQSFKIYNAKTLAGIQELVPSEEEVVKMFNRGIDVKQQNKARSLLLATDENGEFTFTFTEDAHDLRSYVAEPTASRGTSTMDKVTKLIGNLPPDQLEQIRKLLALA